MSFLIKNPSITPGFAIYRPNTNASNILFFQEGTFEAIEGNGTTTLTFEGGYRYFIQWDYASSNNYSSATFFTCGPIKYYGNVQTSGATLYSRQYSTTSDQRWLGSMVLDAHSDFTFVTNNSNQSQSSTVSVWRFPL
jgi:hypothetical protein